MTAIWDSTATTPAATHRVPVDRSSSSSPAHWTGQQIADVRAYIGETVNSLGPINTNQSLSLADGRYIAATITGNVQFTFTSVPTGATDLFLELTDAGAYAITFAASLTWTGGTAPTLPTSGVALLHLRTRNGGTTYLASMVSDEQEFAASAITSGTLATARLGSGTANSGTFLRGDQTWAAVGPIGGSDTQVVFNDGGTAAGDAGLTYNKTTDTLTVAGPVLRSGSGARILVGTGTGASDICLWTTPTGLVALNGNNSFVQTFRASTITADSGFVCSSGGLLYGVYGWGSLNSSVNAFVRHTASELCVTGATTTYDTILTRSAANTLALRNATNAQTFLVGGTWTDASNYVQGSLAATSTAVTLSAITAGTGADNVPVNINAAGTSPIAFGSPAQAKSYTVATVPSASASGAGAIIYVTDESGGAVLAFSDATDWRRVTDRAVIS